MTSLVTNAMLGRGFFAETDMNKVARRWIQGLAAVGLAGGATVGALAACSAVLGIGDWPATTADGGTTTTTANRSSAGSMSSAATTLLSASTSSMSQADGDAAPATSTSTSTGGSMSGSFSTNITGLDAGAPRDASACATMWPDASTNVITNPNFEDGGAGWDVLYGGNFMVTSSTAYCGDFSGELSGRTAFYQGLATNLPTIPATYNIAMWALQDGTTAVQLAAGGVCVLADGGLSDYTATVDVTASPNTWTFISGTITVPDGCATMQFVISQPTSAVLPFPDIFADEVFVGR